MSSKCFRTLSSVDVPQVNSGFRIPIRACDGISIWAECYVFDAFRMSCDCVSERPGMCVPQIDASFTCACDGISIWAECYVRDIIPTSCDRVLGLARSRVPQADGTVPTRACDGVSIWAECDACDSLCMSCDCASECASVCVR